jgi:ferritin-like metal-binding protein YciE
MALNSLRDLLTHEIQDLYSAETQITKALPKMVQAAHSPDLQAAFQEHLNVTQEHVTRLETIARQLQMTTGGQTCKGMQGLLEEGKDLMQEQAEDWVMDAGLIGAAQRVEHYEIAAYGTARDHAEKLGLYDVARTLQQTLDEEGEADKKLTELASSAINAMAAM